MTSDRRQESRRPEEEPEGCDDSSQQANESQDDGQEQTPQKEKINSFVVTESMILSPKLNMSLFNLILTKKHVYGSIHKT